VKEKTRIACRETIAVGLVRLAAGNGERCAVHLLESVPKHRPIDLVEEAMRDLDLVLRRDAKQVAIERRVVDLAERQAVRDVGQAFLVAVWSDVGSVEELSVVEATHGAPSLIRGYDSTAEVRLVKALPHEPLHVRALWHGFELTREQPCALVKRK